jgi:hypothetical protein
MLIQTINGKYPKSQALICDRYLCLGRQKGKNHQSPRSNSAKEEINDMSHIMTNRQDK